MEHLNYIRVDVAYVYVPVSACLKEEVARAKDM